MLIYIFRGISAILAVLYTVTSICVLSVPTSKPEVSAVFMPEESISKGQDKTSVKILQTRDNTGLLLQQALDLYSKNGAEDISFSVRTIEQEADYHSALRASLLANDGADLFQIGGAREYLELASYIRPLDFADWVESAHIGSIDAVSHDGKIYGVPYSIEAVGLICSREAFEAVDILPEKIRSLEDLDEAFAKIKEGIALGDSEAFIGMEYVTELAAGDKAFLGTRLADIALSGAFGAVAEAAQAESVSFPAAEQAEEFVKIMAKYSQSRSDWTKLAQITEAQQIERLANGRVAAILQDTNAYKRINEINPDMRGKLLLIPIPMEIFEQPSVYAGSPSYWTVNAAASDKTAEAAVDFLEWIYMSDEGGKFFAEEFGEASAFRGTAKSTGISLHSQMLSYMSVGMYMPQLAREYPAGWGKNVFAPNVQSYFTEREKTWEEVIEACETGWSD